MRAPQRRYTPGEPIVTADIHDALIDQETFDRVQAEAGHTTPETQPNPQQPLLAFGLIHCGHCGGIMAGRGYKAKGTYTNRYYTCTTAASHPGACACYQVPTAAIEDYVLGLVEKRLGGDEVVEQIRAAIHRKAKKQHRTRAQRIVCGAALRRWTRRSSGERRISCLPTPTIWPTFRGCLATGAGAGQATGPARTRGDGTRRYDRRAAGGKSNCRTEAPTEAAENQRPRQSAGSSQGPNRGSPAYGSSPTASKNALQKG